MARTHLDKYKQTAVQTSSPLQLVVMLYDGALRNMSAGRQAIVVKETYKQNQELQKAQRIVAELMSCLDMEKGLEVARNLFALYSFVYDKLVEANLTDSTEALDQAARVLSDLRQSWVELENSIGGKDDGSASAA